VDQSERSPRDPGLRTGRDPLIEFWTEFGQFIVRRHGRVTAACFLVFSIGAVGLPKLNTSVHLIKLFDGDAKIIRDYDWLEEHLGKLVPMELVVRVPPDHMRSSNSAVLIFGMMGHAGILVDIGTMMTASVAMGVAVDDTIHFLTWFRDGIAAGLPRHSAIIEAYRRCAAAMTQTTLIGGLGLAVFAFSTHCFRCWSKNAHVASAAFFAVFPSEAMALSLEDHQRVIGSDRLHLVVKRFRLFHWHQRVLVAVQRQNGWGVLVDVGDWTSRLVLLGSFAGCPAHEQAKNPCHGTVLVAEGHVGWTEHVDNRLHPTGLVGISAVSFQARRWIGKAHQQRKMTTSGSSRDPDPVRIDLVLLGMGAQPTDGRFGIVDLCRENWGGGRGFLLGLVELHQPVTDGRCHVAPLGRLLDLSPVRLPIAA
jgi:hypothetical protein